MQSWIIGVLLAFSGSCVSNLGVNLQKLTHNRLKQEYELTGKRPGSAYKQPMWLLGLTCVIAGSVADLVSFGFADMSLLAPLGAMTLVVNLFFAPCFLKEGLTKRDIICTLIILAGTVLAVAFGSKSEKTYTLSTLVKLYQAPLFIVYACLFVLLCSGIFWWYRGLKRRRKRCQEHPLDGRIEKFVFPFLAGSFGAHSVLFAKSTAEVFRMTFKGNNQFKYPGSYFFVALLLFFLLFQMHFLNMGLARCDALYAVPVYQVCWVIMGCVVGFMYFQDYRTMTSLSLGMFFVGVGVTVAGVYILSQRYSPENVSDKPVIGQKAARKLSITDVEGGTIQAHHVIVEGDPDLELTLAEQAEKDLYAKARANMRMQSVDDRASLLSGKQHTRYTRLSDADEPEHITAARASLLQNDQLASVEPGPITAVGARISTPGRSATASQPKGEQFDSEEETAYGYIAPMAIIEGLTSIFGAPLAPRSRAQSYAPQSDESPRLEAIEIGETTTRSTPAHATLSQAENLPAKDIVAQLVLDANISASTTLSQGAATQTTEEQPPDAIKVNVAEEDMFAASKYDLDNDLISQIGTPLNTPATTIFDEAEPSAASAEVTAAAAAASAAAAAAVTSNSETKGQDNPTTVPIPAKLDASPPSTAAKPGRKQRESKGKKGGAIQQTKKDTSVTKSSGSGELNLEATGVDVDEVIASVEAKLQSQPASAIPETRLDEDE